MDTKELKYDPTQFSSAFEEMANTNKKAYKNLDNVRMYGRRRKYTPDEINRIVEEGSVMEKILLSRYEYNQGGTYFRIISHYATVLKYAGILIPHARRTDKLSVPHMTKGYERALDYLEGLSLPVFFHEIAIKVLRDGSYYGIITSDRNGLSIIDLPISYCRTNFKDVSGNNLVEFNVQYFTNIIDENDRRRLLALFPKEISIHYHRYRNNLTTTPWMLLPPEVGIYFGFGADVVPFASVLKSIDIYEETTEAELARVKEEIRKILVQKIPHLADGTLLFEPPEAKNMHEGAVDMLAHNENVSVLTTYADADILNSKTSNEAARRTTMESMSQAVYAEAGASSQIFAATNSQALKFSMMNDIQFMMIIGEQFAQFITNILNRNFGNQNIGFKYKILPVSIYTETEYISNAFKLSQSGYSFLVPAVAMGMSQRDLIDLKELENEVLKLTETLEPLQSSYTQSSKDGEKKEEGAGPGRPEKPLEEKSEKTIRNKEAQNEGGE